MVNKAISSAIGIVGSQQKLAEACGVRQPTVWAWLHGKKKASASNAIRIERATNGEVQAYEIRPDLPDLFPHPNHAN
ncbi:helix-turn-helix domain-containing protein [Enterobacter asburiae]|jgi:DNA-binding transcriptional regulator YdaS (Cro superfamily)|uniref:Helix-turn-helix domain-containing protein n=1 Tax=Enterobacter cloacae TaxID=550 RepID=A0AAW6SCZ9_ENTCL|nr:MULTISPECIES: helix-turn-helix domain-containing protein [Enterobacteriaceae]AVG34848.1 transcriptional regulator [Enterobacter cloacae complex sp.]EIJ6689992.1 helix-turn-helix domain-containing protein [Escherichia coli]HEH9008906.1 helix-turn-helix domain-containing protein [Salmonella enterica]EKV6296086.1 helix-turn-helix domain-containing protein [Citrobacter freundii]EKW9110291.1 helix-turn-helix domain-containing protein [Citrobacter freundii]